MRTAALTLLLAVAVGGLACHTAHPTAAPAQLNEGQDEASASADRPQTSQSDAWFDLVYTGGFYGQGGRVRAVEHELLVAEPRGERRRALSERELAHLERLMGAVDWTRLAEPAFMPGSDLFLYSISLNHGQTCVAARTTSGTDPATAALVAYVFALAYGDPNATNIDRPTGWISPQDNGSPLLGAPVPMEPPSSIHSFVANVRAAATGADADPQACLRSCARLVWTDCVDRSWEAVRNALEHQGAVLDEEERPNQASPWRLYRWVAVQSAYRTRSGTPYQLVVEFSVAGKGRYVERGNTSFPVYDGPLLVHRATASLKGHPGSSSGDLLMAGEFAASPAIEMCLSSEELKEDMPRDWPIDDLEISYEPFQWVSPFGTNMGYSITIKAHGAQDPRATRGAYARVIAHLDPTPLFNWPRTWLITPPGFGPTTELGPVESAGSYSSVAGEK